MSLVPSVDGSAADRPVQLREEDLEMSIFLPPVIRKSFEEVSAQLQTLFKLCRDMEANVGLKSDKAHMLLVRNSAPTFLVTSVFPLIACICVPLSRSLCLAHTHTHTLSISLPLCMYVCMYV